MVADTALESLLAALAVEVEVPESKYDEARDHYAAVGVWLAGADSELSGCNVRVSAQGSFALGTAIKPPEGGDYDVDAVCLVTCPPSWSQEDLKQKVGTRLKAHATYRKMLDPPEGGRRCWTIKYADDSHFHLDVLPAKPDDPRWLHSLNVPPRYAEPAIQITCRDHYADPIWPKSNPEGYRRWFIDRMRVRFDEARATLAKARAAEVHAIPEYAVQTPLQRVVQILKRQRDLIFGDDPDRPISIIITTLAAQAYQNEPDLVSAYRRIVRGMRSQLQQAAGKYVLLNPVNPRENFADRWVEHKQRQDRFFDWLDEVEATERELAGEQQFAKRADVLVEHFGPTGARAAEVAQARTREHSASVAEAVGLAKALPDVLRAAHRETPTWTMKHLHRATIAATATRSGFRPIRFSDKSPSPPLAKNMELWFSLTTDASPPFDVFWQVVNTGTEAEKIGQLRGGFDKGDVRHRETTSYRGKHSIQAFVVKENVCLAESRPVFVLIK